MREQCIAFHPTQTPISSTDGSTHCLSQGCRGGAASVAVAFDTTQITSPGNYSVPKAGLHRGRIRRPWPFNRALGGTDAATASRRCQLSMEQTQEQPATCALVLQRQWPSVA
jgi:hypothetical protein